MKTKLNSPERVEEKDQEKEVPKKEIQVISDM